MRDGRLRAAKKIVQARNMVASAQRDLEPGPHDAALVLAISSLRNVETLLAPKPTAAERREA